MVKDENPEKIPRILQPCCLKKEREHKASSARAPYMNPILYYGAILTRGSPTVRLIAKEANGQA